MTVKDRKAALLKPEGKAPHATTVKHIFVCIKFLRILQVG